VFFSFSCDAFSQLGPSDVLILVNANSPTSRYIAKMYRCYYPAIQNNQVLELSGLADCSGLASTAADEIITRQQYNTLIAQPLRNHLLTNNLATTIKAIITTAGLPYRIEDTRYPNVIYPAGSNYTDVSGHLSEINAASVESELTCLWYSDYGPNPFGIDNRMVNPYQGYHQSSISLFPRVEPNSKLMDWEAAFNITGVAPKMEGNISQEWPNICYGTMNRVFHAGDMYLTCRLDGPKNQGQTAVFAVRKMLERAKRVSNPAKGVNPLQAVAVIDDAPGKTTDRNRIYNIDKSVNYIVYDAAANQPPNACGILTKDDYTELYTVLTNGAIVPNGFSAALSVKVHGACVLLDQRAAVRTSQTDLDALLNNPNLGRQGSQRLLALACYGMYNGDEAITKQYLLNGGPNGGPLYQLVNGAVFTSIESFNGVTLFSDAVTIHAKIVDFICIGGTGAIGHSFEPVSDAVIDNLFFLYNLLADEDGDGYADLSFVEAAFTGIPYLSWTEVVIGDPLMRIAYGPGEQAWTPRTGDCNTDDVVNVRDVRVYSNCTGGDLNSADPAYFQLYNDLADFNCDGVINVRDLRILQNSLY
jgi:rhodanese-related sulfurtransferase